MTNEITNHEIFRDELLKVPGMKAKFALARVKVKFDLMLYNLRNQVIAEKRRKAVLKQITNISKNISAIYL
jgi:hypothetical protein